MDAEVIDGRCIGSERTLIRELLADAVVDESIKAGYVRTALVRIVVERRIYRPDDHETIDVVLAVLAGCAERAHVVAVVRADHQEACVCTLHGMRWEGEGDPPKVVLKLVDVPMGELQGRWQGCRPPDRGDTPATADVTATGVSAGDAVDSATSLLAAWLMVGATVYLVYVGVWFACRLVGRA